MSPVPLPSVGSAGVDHSGNSSDVLDTQSPVVPPRPVPRRSSRRTRIPDRYNPSVFSMLQGTGGCTDRYPERAFQRVHAIKSVLRVILSDIENQ